MYLHDKSLGATLGQERVYTLTPGFHGSRLFGGGLSYLCGFEGVVVVRQREEAVQELHPVAVGLGDAVHYRPS